MEITELLNKSEINGNELEFLLQKRKEKKADFLLVDVREEYEFQQKRITGVDYLMPISNFFEKSKQIEEYKNTPIISQCKLGGRSAQAQRQLQIMGFKKVINLAGGIENYKGEKE
tara:strand:+ start:282 stop:626 length:345 start_codon:yes stop_codon:yes gene_type:complete